MAFSDRIIQSGTVIDVYVPHQFTKLAMIKVETHEGKILRFMVKMAKVRALANQILGYNSQSMTELRETFISYAINKQFVFYVEYASNRGVKNLIRAQAKKTGWGLV